MKTLLLPALAALLLAGPVRADIPISGRPVPTMAPFDDAMTGFMAQYGIEAGVLGIMKDDRVVYLRGFGHLDPDTSTDMPENALVRQASATKPATAAAIRRLAAEGAFGPDGIERRAFNVTVDGVNNNGLLAVAPSPSLGDKRIKDITLRHLLEHKGGFNRNDPNGPGDTPLRPRKVAEALNVLSPPSRASIINYTLGWPLAFTPGTAPAFIPSGDRYSNFGYLVLGEIIAQAWAGGYVDCLHSKVFEPAMWVPRSEMKTGFTLRENHDAREPWYRVDRTGSSVFDNSDPVEQLNWEYGGYYSMSNIMAHGGLIASAPAMLHMGNAYRLDYPNIGTPAESAGDAHGGLLWGVQTNIRRRSSDGVVFYVFINQAFVDKQNQPTIPISTLSASIDTLLDAGSGSTWSWPATTSDGFWVLPTSALPDTGTGGYHSYWRGFGNAITKAGENSRIRVKAGTTNWTGTISKRLHLDAPLGNARIGFQ